MPARNRAQPDQVLQTGRIIYGDDGSKSYPVKVRASGSTGIVQTDVLNTETIQTELLTPQSVAASTYVVSSVLSIVGVKRATFFIDHGRTNTVAFGTNGTEYRIEGSQQASGNDTWVPLASVLCASTACLAVAASADVVVGGGTVTVTSGTSIPARGDIVFWANTVSAASSEWMEVTSVSGTASFNILNTLRYGQDSDTNIFTQAQRIPFSLNLETITRVRAVVNNNASGTTQAVYSRVAMISAQ